MTYAPSIGTRNWIDRKVDGLPTRWKRKLLHRWESEVPGGRNFDDKAGQHPEYFANRNLSVWADRRFARQ